MLSIACLTLEANKTSYSLETGIILSQVISIWDENSHMIIFWTTVTSNMRYLCNLPLFKVISIWTLKWLVSSFFLELFLHSSPVAYWAPTNLGSSSFSVLSFFTFHTVHEVLKARILKWFAIPISNHPVMRMHIMLILLLSFENFAAFSETLLSCHL